MEVTPLPILIVVIPVHALTRDAPIVVTLSGIKIEVSAVQ